MSLCLPPCLPICFNRPYGEHPYQDIVDSDRTESIKDSGNNEVVKETNGTTAIKQSQKYFVEKVE